MKDLDRWRKYSDVENDLIETAHHENQDQVELDDYIINLKKFVQIKKSNPGEQHSVKRISCEDVLHSRLERLSSTDHGDIRRELSREENNRK